MSASEDCSDSGSVHKEDLTNLSGEDSADEDLEPPVDLGFLEEDGSRLDRWFFPSKAGGKPAWLNPVDLPDVSTLTCANCEDPLTFVAQVYAPIDAEDADQGGKADTYHRTIFVFCCKKGSCNFHTSSVRALRCQLPQQNSFYPAEEVEEGAQFVDPVRPCSTCDLCGLKGVHVCGKCRKRHYCSKKHQVVDWKSGHKQECGTDVAPTRTFAGLFKEFEVVIEAEPPAEERDSVENMPEKMRELYENYKNKMKDGSAPSTDEPAGDATKNVDLALVQYQLRTGYCHDQVIRHCRYAEASPLWVASEGQLSEGPPPCEACGAQRIFEFQILPQMLFFIQEEDLETSLVDWGTLAVYTCSASCSAASGSSPYIPEFVFKQHILEERHAP